MVEREFQTILPNSLGFDEYQAVQGYKCSKRVVKQYLPATELMLSCMHALRIGSTP